ncbi:pre-mRNA-splicing factor CWC22-like protein [Platysternon megacephalum]|uniref:Pre-mRNA-splicing factor CWC22-like protein n=1 Tax=Platysternon megacephalum TaxID=55544 RepID=A0A4D9E6E2_9SAUR|nr:pre-mRNA-splicing factor CWC22-like protein [Platysternon megacephalum]
MDSSLDTARGVKASSTIAAAGRAPSWKYFRSHDQDSSKRKPLAQPQRLQCSRSTSAKTGRARSSQEILLVPLHGKDCLRAVLQNSLGRGASESSVTTQSEGSN